MVLGKAGQGGKATDGGNSRVDIFDQDGQRLAAWKPFGRQSGIWIEKNDTLATDSESEEHRARRRTIPAANLACSIGRVKTGKVDHYIPPPPSV